MLEIEGLVFISSIKPSLKKANQVIKLTRQDAKAGRLKTLIKQLRMPTRLKWQQSMLRDNPERYCGYELDGKLVAYLKQAPWLAGDELPFARGAHAEELQKILANNQDPSTGEWGVLGLVVSDKLDSGVRDAIYDDLLQRSFADPVSGDARTVNVVIHDNDPLLPVAQHHNFLQVGKKGEAAGAPGRKQRRYKRLASA